MKITIETTPRFPWFAVRFGEPRKGRLPMYIDGKIAAYAIVDDPSSYHPIYGDDGTIVAWAK